MRAYLRVANVHEARIELDDVKEMHFTADERKRYRLEAGDILLNEGQTPELLGRPAMWVGQRDEMYFTNSLIRFRAYDGVLPSWALLVFRHHMHFGRFTRESRITTNIAHLALGRCRTVEFPVPPLEEQRRITRELDRRCAHVDAAVHGLQLSLGRIEMARRSVLAKAFAGSLVSQANDDEPALNLIKQCSPNVETELHADRVLPRGWAAVPLDVLADIRLGRQRSPKNHTGPNMRPYLRAANVKWTGLDLSDVKQMHFTEAEVETYRLLADDIVMSEASGSPGEVGKPALWQEELDDCCIQNTLIRVRTRGAIDPRFLLHRLWFEASLGRWSRELARGVGIHHLGSTNLKRWMVDVPPIAEQRRIVMELERRLSLIDAAGRTIEASLRKADELRRSLLQQAYIGRLVVQDQDGLPSASGAGERIEDLAAVTPSTIAAPRDKESVA